LIGEHTDYNDGFVLPCAISKQTMVAVRKRDDGVVRVVAGDLNNATTEFSVSVPVVRSNDAPWSNYVRGMVDGLQTEGIDLTGADIAIVGDMPQGAGLSSSAALENAVGLALATLVGQADIDRALLARLGQRTEHLFAGCHCGIMDQLVSAQAQEGSALLIDCRSLETQAVAIPDNLAIMIVHSGIERGLVDGAYNDRRAQCEAAAGHYGVAALRDLTQVPEQGTLDALAYRRARHVISENARVLAATDALRGGDLETLGALMVQSHMSMRDDFEITLPAIDALVTLLSDTISKQGGARMTGGGFGGAVVALLPVGEVARVSNAVRQLYKTPSGCLPEIMVERPGPGASIIY
jgi:galactokinase